MRVVTGAAWALAVTLVAAPVAAQQQAGFIPTPPPKGQWEVRGLDFRPNGGLRVQYRQLAQQRRAMLAARNIQGANALQPVSGFGASLNIPVFLFQFKNGSAPFPVASYNSVFFANPPTDGRPYSLRTYYQALSSGRFDITGNIDDWVTLSQDSSYYGANCRAIFCTTGMAHLYQGLVEAITKDSAGVNWANYDSNNDGVVDFVIFVQPLIGGECIPYTTTPTGNNIWAHRYSLSGLASSGGVIGGGAFVTDTPWPGHPGQFITIDDYTVQSGQGGLGSCTAGQLMPIGTVAHETGHTFGLPDLYDTDQNASTSTEGIGSWGLMGSGNYTVPESPSFYDAWSRFYMGWANFDTVSTTATTTLGPVETSDTVLYVASTSPSEFYLLENRQALKSDSGMINPNLGSQLKGPGLLVWHIDQTIINAGMAQNTVNSQVAHGGHEGVELLQADGLNQLLTPGASNRGDPGDPFPGTSGNRTLGYTTNPNLLLHSGALAGFKVDSIYQVSADGPIAFRFIKSAPWLVTSTQAAFGGQVTVNGVTAVTYREVFGLGDSVHVSAADSQLVNSGRTRLTFPTSGNRWSNGQTGKSFAVAAAGTPDTVNALFNAAHRVKVVVSGLGTVSGPAGDTTAAGAFVAAGTPESLTATPKVSQTFTNWTGDTTTSNVTVVLPMNRPYNLTANFSGAVAVTVQQATAEILGTPTLTAQQKTYLDQIGNNNSTYDLGDFLAFLKQQGVVASPALLTKILSRQPAAPVKER
ncbi:MAG TPA: M6 family metalloprotease domain-containing protein [Gemmatimonadales bacterium]|nr:M6 family metalloprotease domain-containing protein [Gemmatimonadales bacterium]